MLRTRAFLAAVGAGFLAIGFSPAHADEQASAIVEKMLAQKADMIRQAESYIVQESHDMGTAEYSRDTIQPTLLYSSVCNLDRWRYLGGSFGRLSELMEIRGEYCEKNRPNAYSIIRPKEMEYMVQQGKYKEDKNFAGMKDIVGDLVTSYLRSKTNDRSASYLDLLPANGARSALDDYGAKSDFSLEYLRLDVLAAIREREDLREFARVAVVTGEIIVDGRPAWALVARDLNRKEVTKDGTFTITGIALAVDKTRHVQLAMFVDGLSQQGKRGKEQRFWIVRQDKNYRPIEGTTALIPYETVMALNFKLEDEESQRELEEARAELEKAQAEFAKAQKQLDAVNSGGPLAALGIGGMFSEQIDKMKQRLVMLEAAATSDARQNLEIKTLTAAQMEEVFNGDGVGDTRKISYARKGGIPEYFAALQGEKGSN